MAVDLEMAGLEALFQEQTRVLDEIHLLARAYHWTESEVLAVSPQRRAFYLASAGNESFP